MIATAISLGVCWRTWQWLLCHKIDCWRSNQRQVDDSFSFILHRWRYFLRRSKMIETTRVDSVRATKRRSKLGLNLASQTEAQACSGTNGEVELGAQNDHWLDTPYRHLSLSLLISIFHITSRLYAPSYLCLPFHVMCFIRVQLRPRFLQFIHPA